MKNKPKRIAVFGGVFDPVHIGHIKAAQIADRELCPDELIFVPAGNPPHKVKLMNTAENRMKMLSIAVKDAFGEKAKLCGYEVENNGFSYTSDTLMHLRTIYGMDAVSFEYSHGRHDYTDGANKFRFFLSRIYHPSPRLQ